MSVWYSVRANWRAGLVAIFVGVGPVCAETPDGVSIRLEGRLIEAAIPVPAAGAYRAAVSEDGLIATIQIDQLQSPPRLDPRASWPDPIAAVFAEKTSGGARLTIFSRQRLSLATPTHVHDGAITLVFELPSGGLIPERPIAAAPGWMETPLAPPKEVRLARAREPAPAGASMARIEMRAPAGMPPRDPTYVAALNGNPAAQLQLGTLCLAPESPDASCARFWFERAALHGNEIAAYNLGRFAAKGIAGPLDEAEAARWFQLSADRGYAEAQYALALLMLEGRGTPQDIARAQDLLQKAGLKGHGPARRLLDDLKLQLSARVN